ncbi:MAG: c-type cytochrome [Isosphaeraceae bacterium]
MIAFGWPMALTILGIVLQDQAPTLGGRLASEGTARLAGSVRAEGDPARGAVVFHQRQSNCVQCHAEGANSLGPDLAAIGKDVSVESLIESILEPSKVIRKGYETLVIATTDGRVVTGRLVEEDPDRVVIRDPARPDQLVVIPKSEVESRQIAEISLMPAGLVETLGSRQRFLDLVRYLKEIADGGPGRALALRPDPAQIASPALPDYEREVDHAGMIADLGPENFRRGERIYNLVCVNCHGTKDRPGSLPSSPRFASGAFKNGSDPFSMYRTLTHGFNQMVPQSWMVPRQKYDVIHYVREAYLRPENPSQYARVDRDYLTRLPRGTTRGPEPSMIEPWSAMDYGPALSATYEIGEGGTNFAYKGVAIRLDHGPGGVSRGRAWAVYDHDTMNLSACWTGSGFIDWNGINFNGRHEVHPRVVGKIALANPAGPGWADPATGRFEDPRHQGRDGRPYGPLPRSWLRYRGQYRDGDRVVLAYSVGATQVLDMAGIEADPARVGDDAIVFTRTLHIGPSQREMLARVAPNGVGVTLGDSQGAELIEKDGSTLLRLLPSDVPRAIKLFLGGDLSALRIHARHSPPPIDLTSLTHGGPKRWPDILKTTVVPGRDDGPFAVDVLTHPASNPWNARMRLSGLDFFGDGRRAALCDWDGDVWIVDGLDSPSGELSWRKIASGLFQPLGLKIVKGAIYVGCRDQIAILRDLNGDDETDFYECFNTDHQVTEHFHEFAMDLQTDDSGNFYYTKGARHALRAVVPQHGTLLRVSRDGSTTEILATGFRAPNGVCLNADGTFFVTDQEGHWIPKNRVNLVKPGGFYGNLWAYHDVTDPSDSAMEPPVCWITNAFDRSPAQIVRVASRRWAPLDGLLLNLSYGCGKVFVVLTEAVGDRLQGGMIALPIPQLATGLIRGRFRPGDGQLYTCGLFAWAGNQEQPGGFYRIRRTETPARLPIALHAKTPGIEIVFADPLDRDAAADIGRFAVKTWALKRSREYGSPHLNEAPSVVKSTRLSADGRTLLLEIDGLRPTWCMEIVYNLKADDGSPVRGKIHNTIHALGD